MTAETVETADSAAQIGSLLQSLNSMVNRSSAERTVLHVGCGPANPAGLHNVFRGPGWRELRLDINPAVEPDVVGSFTNMEMVATSSVDALWTSHTVEHLYPHEVAVAFAEIFRVLKPGGVALLTLPDLQSVAELIVANRLTEVAYISPAGPVTPLDILYGFRPSLAGGNLFMAHHTGFTAKTLGLALLQAGLGNVRVERTGLDLWAVAEKPVPVRR
jgi:SAM-dependent methyltransferase